MSAKYVLVHDVLLELQQRTVSTTLVGRSHQFNCRDQHVAELLRARLQ
ncbi:MAG: hypothetical protein U0931_07115 [Vulcanimicrobiota bacterium]